MMTYARDRQGKFRRLAIGLGTESLRYSAQSDNVKTGNIPQLWIGKDKVESRETCSVCPLLHDKTCYAQYGSPIWAFASIQSAEARGKDYSLETALAKRSKRARFVRLGALGDPASISADVLEAHTKQIREENLGILSYTHHWYLPHAAHLKGQSLASCDTWKDVQDSVSQQWRATWHIDADTALPNGQSIRDKPQGKIGDISYTLCPAQRPEILGKGKAIACNDCGLCDGTRSAVDVIVFAKHGGAMQAQKGKQ